MSTMKKTFKIKAVGLKYTDPDVECILQLPLGGAYVFAKPSDDLYDKIKTTGIQLIVLSEDNHRPKQNTNTFSEGINGDWFWCSKFNSIGCIGDITSFDFRIAAAYPELKGLPVLSTDLINEWINSQFEEIELECVPTYVIDDFGNKVPYAFEKGDMVIYEPKINERNEIIYSMQKDAVLDISQEKQISLTDEQILVKEIGESALACANRVILIENSDKHCQMGKYEGFIEGAKSESAKNYWTYKLKDYFLEAFMEGNNSATMPDGWNEYMEKFFTDWFSETFEIFKK